MLSSILHSGLSEYDMLQLVDGHTECLMKKILILPLNRRGQWSVLAIFNPGSITLEHSHGSEQSFMLFLDPLGVKSIVDTPIIQMRVISWLNKIYQTSSGKYNRPYNLSNMVLYKPDGASESNCKIFIIVV
jgi:hypothetical protein